jgi:hypothetical protein
MTGRTLSKLWDEEPTSPLGGKDDTYDTQHRPAAKSKEQRQHPTKTRGADSPTNCPWRSKTIPRRRWHRENQAKKNTGHLGTTVANLSSYHEPQSKKRGRRSRTENDTNHTRRAVNMQIQGGARGRWCAWPVRLWDGLGENKEAPQEATPRAASGRPA